MCIGYSFKDSHINEVLVEGLSEHSLKLFIIDPLGADAVSQSNTTRRGLIYESTPIEKAVQLGLIGASRRPLLTTFESDHAELTKVQRFFD
jgi:hypothetical protein